jgi:SAM-dependent methyltransferase
METSNCIVCGQPVAESWLLGCRDLYLGTPHVVDYGVCQGCRLVQQVPLPADTGSFYPRSYPMHLERGKAFILARKLLIRGVYFKPGPGEGGAVLMDFGCGDGSYLQSIRGKVGTRIGFEPSPEQAARVQRHLGCAVHSSLAEAGAALEGGIDIITAHFVLEHLLDLHSSFRFWSRILRPGGTVHIVVPNIRSREARMFGARWHGADPPRHISFPDADSLTKLADQYDFRITGSRPGIFPNTWAASLATVVAGRYRNPLFLAFIPLGFVLACLFPQSTTIFTLQKNP